MRRARYNASKDRDTQFKFDVKEFIESQVTVLKNPTLFNGENSVNETFLNTFSDEYYVCTERQELYIVQCIYAKWKTLNWLSL